MRSILLSVVMLLVSCQADDDICVGGEGTPRMKIKFKTEATGKPRTMDSIFVSVDYGSGPVAVVENFMKTDSLLIPLRVEDVPFTDLYISTSKAGSKSRVRVSYSTKSEYVSPACGIRKMYENVSCELQNPNPVLGTETAQNEIVNESKTHLFLLF
jgi:hypothetical protein